MVMEVKRQTMTTYQDLLKNDTRTVPSVLLSESPWELAENEWRSGEISSERYYSREFHHREVEKVWKKVWQMACHEEDIPEVGDHMVYDIAGISVIVVRTAIGVKAYYNACLHRGTQLCEGRGNAVAFRCTFHGWTFGLDGTLTTVPSQWDFPGFDRTCNSLPECKVGSWGGFIFINMDPDCETLDAFLKNIPDHFRAWPLERQHKAVHVQKVIRANWKVTEEAFLESYHVIATHPQLLPVIGDANSQYDVYGRHSRMLTPTATPSPHIGDVDEQEMVDILVREVEFVEGSLTVPEGGTARATMSARLRVDLGQRTGVDYSTVSDAMLLDSLQYLVFPNLLPWARAGFTWVKRFRPNGDDPESSVMDAILLVDAPDGVQMPPPPPPILLGPDEPWGDVKELLSLGRTWDQDTGNLEKIQRGLRSLHGRGVTLANYQESRIRHLHKVIDSYLKA